ncbi:uroporphyrinogen decarboxylase family protein, partial [Nodularia spumigena]
SGSAGVLERMPKSGADIVTVDWAVDMAEARARLGKHVKVQGNLDPGVLFGSQDFIRDRILDTVHKAGNWGHILNLGHGVLPETPEENVAFFFETAKQLKSVGV